jgi:hypothetical protein
VKEPSIIIRPIGRFGGLDNLHVTFAIVIALLLLLLLVVSYSKPVLIVNSTLASNCTYGYLLNGSCARPAHNTTQVETMVERVLASYTSVNSSLSLLPYIANVSSMNATYLPQGGEWYVSMKAANLGTNSTFLVSFLVNDANLSRVTPSIQSAIPSTISGNREVSQGVIKLAGKYACLSQSPVNTYWFIDPYAPGSIKSLLNATSIQGKLGRNVNVTVKVLYGAAAQHIGQGYGTANAQLLGQYVLCASQQPNFRSFASNLNSLYSGSYVPGPALANVANVSSLNYSAIRSCVSNSTQEINAQALLAGYFNITQTPLVIVNCEYLAIPQTASRALCYASNSLC